MNIGILTMHRIVNYGSALQAYGLKKVLESYGHECKFVDVVPGRKIEGDVTKIQLYRRKVHNVIIVGPAAYIKSRRFNILRKGCIDSFLSSELGVTAVDYDVSNCDAVVVGSDEVFNVLQNSPWGLSHQLLGDIDCKKKISYAASFGHTSLQKINQYDVRKEISEQLIKFDAISVRDNNSAEIIKNLLNVEPSVNLDPVLVYPFTSEILETSTIPSKYIVVYGYNNRIRDPKVIQTVKKYAKDNDLIVVSAGNYQSWCDRKIACSPFELLGLFKNAECVLSDTFHGTVLAIKYRKPFATIVRESNKQKMTDLLQRFDLMDHICGSEEDIIPAFRMDIDLSNISKCIKAGIEQTDTYFHKNGL